MNKDREPARETEKGKRSHRLWGREGGIKKPGTGRQTERERQK